MKDTITILEEEHKHILGALDSLEKIIGKEKFNAKDIETLKEISHILTEAEKHHKREEDVLFPAIEKKGVIEPTHVMRAEHEEIRKRKKEIRELLNENQINIKKIKEAAQFVLEALRAHIDKENNVLYVIAREVLSKGEIMKMKKEFDKIGYCCFHPPSAKKNLLG